MRALKWLVPVGIAVAVFFGVRAYLGETSGGSETEVKVAEGLAEAAAQLNAQAPIKLDNITTLVSAKADHVTMIYLNQVAVDPGHFEEAKFEADQKTRLIGFVCGEENMRKTLNLGGRFRYDWIDKTGEAIGSVSILRSDCP